MKTLTTLMCNPSRALFWCVIGGLVALGLRVDPGFLSIGALSVAYAVMLIIGICAPRDILHGHYISALLSVLVIKLILFETSDIRSKAHAYQRLADVIEARAPNSRVPSDVREFLASNNVQGLQAYLRKEGPLDPIHKDLETLLSGVTLSKYPELDIKRSIILSDGYISQGEYDRLKMRLAQKIDSEALNIQAMEDALLGSIQP